MFAADRAGLDIYETMNKDGNRPIVSINVLPLVKHNAGQTSKYTDGVHTVITPQQSVPARFIDPKAKNRSRFFCARLSPTHDRGLSTFVFFACWYMHGVACLSIDA